MAKNFDTWTVLPHQPIEKYTPGFWSVQGTMPDPKIKRAMAIGKRSDGRLVIHNGIALGESEMKEIEALGEPGFLVVPNGFHRQDAKIWKDRYPKLKVYCPEGAKKKVAQAVAVDGTYDDYPDDARVKLVHADGTKKREGMMIVEDEGTSVVFNDLVGNMPKLSGAAGFFLAPTGRPAIPRAIRWLFVSDKRAFASHLERLRTPDLERIVVSHGAALTDRPGDTLKMLGDELVA